MIISITMKKTQQITVAVHKVDCKVMNIHWSLCMQYIYLLMWTEHDLQKRKIMCIIILLCMTVYHIYFVVHYGHEIIIIIMLTITSHGCLLRLSNEGTGMILACFPTTVDSTESS